MPLPDLAGAWLGGIYLQSVFLLPFWSLWLALPLPIVIAALWWRTWRVRLAASCALLALLGGLRYQAAVPSFDASHLAHYNDLGEVAFNGVVVGEPDVRDRYVNLTVSARSLETDEATHQIRGLALVRTGRHPSYSYGDELRIQGKLETPPEQEDFSYRDYLARQGIHSMISSGRITLLGHA